jgi:hypothetical protein
VTIPFIYDYVSPKKFPPTVHHHLSTALYDSSTSEFEKAISEMVRLGNKATCPLVLEIVLREGAMLLNQEETADEAVDLFLRYWEMILKEIEDEKDIAGRSSTDTKLLMQNAFVLADQYV